MPKPAHGDGPWGDAIAYWLNVRKWRQADLVRAAASLSKNTISIAANGFDVNTATLRAIAKALKVPIEDVLVSPERRQTREEQRRMIQEAVDAALRDQESRLGSPIDQMERIVNQSEADAARTPQKRTPDTEAVSARRRRIKKQ